MPQSFFSRMRWLATRQKHTDPFAICNFLEPGQLEVGHGSTRHRRSFTCFLFALYDQNEQATVTQI